MSDKELKKVEVTEIEKKDKSSVEIKGNGKKKEKSKASKIVDKVISIIILIACVCGLIYSLSKLGPWLMANIKTNSVVNDINTIAGVGDIPKDENPGVNFGINFETLLQENPEVVGWIRIPGTTVNYAIVQTGDNSKYLTTSLNGTWNQFGWPFMDFRNAPDFTDKNTVLYGHNIASGWMFADLTHIFYGYLGTDIEIDIYRKDYRLLRYKVFSTYSVSPEAYYITTEFGTDEAYSKFLNTITQRSKWNFNQTVGTDDTILTLSTCTADAKGRVVVHAKLISNEEMPR